MKEWWAAASRFEKRWSIGCLTACLLGCLAWLAYGASSEALRRYLESVQISGDTAPNVARFSVSALGWFVFLFAASAGLVVLILARSFAGARARWGLFLLGTLVVLDLARANQPWILFWDRNEQYASNAIVDRLRDRPYEHRVALLSVRPSREPLLLDQLYKVEWLQQLFSYYNIQSIDYAQMPRMPEDLKAYYEALSPSNLNARVSLLGRFYQLTNTRYLLGSSKIENALNARGDPRQRRFHIAERFEVVARPGILRPTELAQLTAVPAPDGQYALYEFAGALPRARLYSAWQVNTNDPAALDQLTAMTFDPEQTVIVAGGVPGSSMTTATNQNAGRVEITSYGPREIFLRSHATDASVLLLNDRFDPNWTVSVDGKPDRVLRCNYLMQGVYLPPGEHAIRFRFRLASWPLVVSLVSTAIAMCLIGVAFATGLGKKRARPAPQPPAPSPAPPEAKRPPVRAPSAGAKDATNGPTSSRGAQARQQKL